MAGLAEGGGVAGGDGHQRQGPIADSLVGRHARVPAHGDAGLGQLPGLVQFAEEGERPAEEGQALQRPDGRAAGRFGFGGHVAQQGPGGAEIALVEHCRAEMRSALAGEQLAAGLFGQGEPFFTGGAAGDRVAGDVGGEGLPAEDLGQRPDVAGLAGEDGGLGEVRTAPIRGRKPDTHPAAVRARASSFGSSSWRARATASSASAGPLPDARPVQASSTAASARACARTAGATGPAASS